MKFLSVLFAVLLCAGCVSTDALYQAKNGDMAHVKSNRLMWQTEQFAIAFQTNGLPIVTLIGSKTDTQALCDLIDRLIQAGQVTAAAGLLAAKKP